MEYHTEEKIYFYQHIVSLCARIYIYEYKKAENSIVQHMMMQKRLSPSNHFPERIYLKFFKGTDITNIKKCMQ